MSPALPLVDIDRSTDGLAVVTLSRPEALNALSRALREQLAVAFDELAADRSLRVLILTGSGRAFCAGLDVKELATLGLDKGREVRDPLAALARIPGPVIGAINGPAITGGFELALACDVLLASSDAYFADTHARIGIMPGWGLSQRLPRRIGASRAKEVSFTGRRLTADQAERWGLVNRVVRPQDLLRVARELAAEMMLMPPAMLAAYKSLIDDGLSLPFGQALALEAERSREANGRVLSGDVASRRDSLFVLGREVR